MNKHNTPLLVALAAVVALIAAAAWYYVNTTLHDARAKTVANTVAPIAALLNDNQKLTRELQSLASSEKHSGIFEAYLALIRRDSVARHVDMKQRLDQLAENNTAIVTLIKAYAPQAKTASFTSEADKFRNYASAWRDRWNSVMELFMAGGLYATAQVQLPPDFADAVQMEIAAARRN